MKILQERSRTASMTTMLSLESLQMAIEAKRNSSNIASAVAEFTDLTFLRAFAKLEKITETAFA